MDGSESYTDENAWLATGMQQNAPAGTPSAASASPTAHMRGLTSTLSGRRTRHEPTPASSGPEVPVAAAAVAPRADVAGRQAHADSYSPHVSPQQAWRPLGRREARGFRGVDSDDEGGQPPASLLVELPHQYGSVAGSRGSAQASVLLEDPRQGGAGGFVRRAAQAVQTRIQDIGGQAAGLPQLGGPMPPPHPRTRDTGRGSGDGRPPLGAGARTAWPRRGGRQRAEARPTHRERALRAWRDVRHQDGFFCRVYAYYAGKGALTIIVSRVLQLATLAFVVVLSTFVFGCIDHAKVRDQKSLAAVVIPQCTRQLSWMATLALWSFAA
ncbi:autophagy protein atg9, partial [Coemansia biformis]